MKGLSARNPVSIIGCSRCYSYYLLIILIAYSKCTPGTLPGEDLLVGSVELKPNALDTIHQKYATAV